MKECGFDLINGAGALVGEVLEARPHQKEYRRYGCFGCGICGNGSFGSGELIDFAVKLLDIPAHGTYLSYTVRRILS